MFQTGCYSTGVCSLFGFWSFEFVWDLDMSALDLLAIICQPANAANPE
jgi:hypothetical protein